MLAEALLGKQVAGEDFLAGFLVDLLLILEQRLRLVLRQPNRLQIALTWTEGRQIE